MILPEISIKRPVLASMMSLALVVVGLVGLSRLPVRELPDVDPPIVNVTTIYPGASAGVVETEVTERVEEVINGVEGIKTLTSESREELSKVTVEFELYRDIDLAAQDVRDRVSRVRGQLPDDIDEPIIAKQESDARPVMWVALYSDRYSTLQLTEIGDNLLKDQLQTVSGVSSVILGGSKRFAIRLRLDSERMAARGVTVLDVERALREQNVELPSGRVENATREFTIETLGELKTADEFNRLVVKREGSTLVRLADVGFAETGVEDERSIARYNSRPAMGLGIVKQSKANTIAVAHGIKAELERLKPVIPEGVETFVAYDESIYVEKAIKEVWITLGIAFMLVVTTIFVFLRNARSTFVPAVTIPVSVIATFAVLSIMGYSINILTMLALVLAIGLVVDDSIVVLENIYRHIERGEKPMKAAFMAMKEISFAVIATTVALVAVLLPLTFQTSLTGRLFIEFAIALCGSVIISTFIALSLTPSLSARILRRNDTEKQGRILQAFERGLNSITRRYTRILEWALQHRKTVVVLTCLSCFAGVYFYIALEREFLPEEDKGRLFSLAIAPEGATSEYTDRMVQKMEGIMKEQPEVAGYFSAVALPMGGPGKASEGLMFVKFKEERARRLQDVLAGPRGVGARFFMEVEGAFAIAIAPKAIGRGFGQPFQLVLKNQDLDRLNEVTAKITQKLREMGVLRNVRSTFQYNKPKVEIHVDRDRAAALGVSIEDISRTLQILFGGRDLSKTKVAGEEYDVIVQLEREKRLTPNDLERLYVRNDRGDLIQLNSVVSHKTLAGPNAIFHYNRMRSATIEGSPVGVPLGTIMQQVEQLLAEELPPSFRYDWTGEARDLRDASQDTLFVVLLAILVIYMVLAAQFESLIHPLTVMVALPLAAIGAFGGLWLLNIINGMGSGFYGWANYAPEAPWFAHVLSAIVPRIPAMTINLFSQIGIVLLLGLVTKNSILLVDFANQAMARGKSARDAMMEAGLIRLRPILMTAFATIAGILPIAIGFGAGGEGRRPMGVAAVGGMLTSTVLTLIVIPVVYTLFDDFARRFRQRKALNAEEEAERARPIGTAALVLLLALFATPQTTQADDLTLERAIAIALEQNTDIKNASEQINKQQGRMRELRSFIFPKVEARGNFNIVDRDLLDTFGDDQFGTNKDWDSRVELTQPLYAGGRAASRWGQAKYDTQALIYEREEITRDTVLSVKERFYALLLARSQVEVQEESVRLLEEQLESEKKKLTAGTVSEFNVLRAEVALANSKTPLIRARNDLKIAIEELSRVLGRGDDSAKRESAARAVGELSYLPYLITLDEALTEAKNTRHSLKRLGEKIEAAKKAVRAERAGFHPIIEAKASYGVEKSRFSDDLDETLDGWRAGLEARWSLFSSFETVGKVDQALADLASARHNLRQAELDVEVEVRRAHSSLLESTELVKASRKVVEQAEESLRLAQNRFDAGVETQLDVLEAQVALTEARSNKIQALHDYNVSVARIETAMGALSTKPLSPRKNAE